MKIGDYFRGYQYLRFLFAVEPNQLQLLQQSEFMVPSWGI